MLGWPLVSCQTYNPSADISKPIVYRTLEIGINGQIRGSDLGEAFVALRGLPNGSAVRLKVDSPGGEVFSALALAQELERHNTTVKVIGNCHSACAQILLYSAKKIEFERGSSVIFHTTPISWIQYNLEGGLVTDEQYIAKSLSLLQFYRRHRVPLDLIDCGAITQDPFGPVIVVDINAAVTYGRRVKKEGLYVRSQDLGRVFAGEKTIIGADNLERPDASVSVSSLDGCSGKLSDGFAAAIALLDKLAAP